MFSTIFEVIGFSCAGMLSSLIHSISTMARHLMHHGPRGNGLQIRALPYFVTYGALIEEDLQLGFQMGSGSVFHQQSCWIHE